MRADLNWLADMTEEQAAAEMARFRRVVERRYEAAAAGLTPATGRHDARASVRSAAIAGQLSHRTDRAARRGLRGRGERR